LCLGEDYEIGENQELVAAAELVDELDLGEDLQIGEGLHLVEVRQNRRRPLYRRGRGPCEAPYYTLLYLFLIKLQQKLCYSPPNTNTNTNFTRVNKTRPLSASFCSDAAAACIAACSKSLS